MHLEKLSSVFLITTSLGVSDYTFGVALPSTVPSAVTTGGTDTPATYQGSADMLYSSSQQTPVVADHQNAVNFVS